MAKFLKTQAFLSFNQVYYSKSWTIALVIAKYYIIVPNQ